MEQQSGDSRIGRILATFRKVEAGASAALVAARNLHDLHRLGNELPAALSALESADHVDEVVDGSRWIASACVANEQAIRSGSDRDAQRFLDLVDVLRTAFAEFDRARNS